MGASLARTVDFVDGYEEPATGTDTTFEVLSAPRNLSILFVEEDDDYVESTSSMLGSMAAFDAATYHATCVESARHALQQQSFDAALIGGCRGLDSNVSALRDLSTRYQLAAPILLTDRSHGNLREDAFRAGAIVCLAKDQLTPLLLEESIRCALYTFSLESRLQQLNLELERARRAHSELISRTLQDLEIPLRAMMQSSNAIVADNVAPLEETSYRDAADLIKASSHYLNELVGGLAKSERKRDGNALDTKHLENIGDLVSDAVRIARLGARKGSRSIAMTLPPRPLHVRGRRTLLMRGVLKILNHAVNATPEGGEIDVRVSHEGRHVRIAIADASREMSGRDIDTALHSGLANGSASNPHSSPSHLNLRGIRDIVAEHKGQLEIESVPGRGTTIALRLPVASEAC